MKLIVLIVLLSNINRSVSNINRSVLFHNVLKQRLYWHINGDRMSKSKVRDAFYFCNIQLQIA